MARILKDPNDRTVLPSIGDDPEYIDPDDERFGYHREISEELIGIGVMAQPIPVLAAIGAITPLPAIVDPIIARYFAANVAVSPRLLAVTRDPKAPRPAQVICAEFPPARVLSRVKGTYYELNLPYVIAAYKPGGSALWLTCRTTPITPDDLALYRLPMPHVRDRLIVGGICITVRPPDRKLEPLAQISEAVRQYQHTGYWYYYQNPHLDKIAAGPKSGTGTGADRSVAKYAHANFTWWEKRTMDEVLAFQYLTAKMDLVQWVTAIQNAKNYPVTFFLTP